MNILKENHKAVRRKEQCMCVNVDLTYKLKAHHQQDVSSILTLEPLYPLMYSKLLLTSVWWKFIRVIYYKNYHYMNRILEHASVEQFPELAILELLYCCLSVPPPSDTKPKTYNWPKWEWVESRKILTLFSNSIFLLLSLYFDIFIVDYIMHKEMYIKFTHIPTV